MLSNENSDTDRFIKLDLWLETGGVALGPRITRILWRRSDEDQQLTVWQLEPFDELISMQVPLNSLRDREIEIKCKISRIDGGIMGAGSIKIFGETGVLKSGLITLILNSPSGNETISVLEDRLYRRKSKQVPIWHVQLMKERLQSAKEEFLEGNPGCIVINFIIPIPSHPIKLREQPTSWGFDASDNLCTWDVLESQEDSTLKRRYPKLFKPLSTIINGDLRAIHGILQRGFDNSAIDSANLLWNCREYLSRHFPAAIVPFVQSVQWWLSASDPTEIDEALRIIESWRLPVDVEERGEICAMLLVKMGKITGLGDSKMWLQLFTRLLPVDFIKKYQSPLILFLTSPASVEMPELRKFLIRGALFTDDLDLASEIYWRLKVSPEYAHVFEEYTKSLRDEFKAEIRKQERLFEGIEQVLLTAQKFKGPRTAKLDLLKKLLADPEASEIPSATQSNPLLPGLQSGTPGRIRAVVPERSNLFKSTAFTVLLVFLRSSSPGLGLPIIFKRGDDLRHDAACLRIFRAIWDIWHRDGGLDLFPRRLLYGVVPLGRDFGMVEFVESVPLSRVVGTEASENGETNEWAVNRYLKELPDPSSAKSNFLASCVGFSLLTYLLGIGDRHLDNLLLTPQGHLLHIDFSFLFGADPKPFSPPIKMTREMVRGFEEATGDDADKWNEFKGLCFTALSLLRRKSALILSLLQSEYPDDSAKECEFVRERLAALVSQAEALQKMDRLLEESRRAMFPQVMETIHKWVQYWKS